MALGLVRASRAFKRPQVLGINRTPIWSEPFISHFAPSDARPKRMPVDSQSSGIQDSISPTFHKLHDLRHLVSLDTHFKKGFTEVIKYWARAAMSLA